MPTTTKLLIVLLLIGLSIYAIMFFLVLWVKPVVTEMTVDIPSSRITLRSWPETEKTSAATPQKPAHSEP